MKTTHSLSNVRQYRNSLCFALTLCLPLAAFAGDKPDPLGAAYRPVSNVVLEQAQVVFYRQPAESRQAANVYLDGSLQNALMPGGYTTFCIKPGQHALEAHIGDAPLYAGKREPKTRATFEGGTTYFLKVAPTDSTPVAVSKVAAETDLKGIRQQKHVIDRSSAVIPCRTLEETRFSLRGDVVFRFGKSSYEDITAAGHEELRKVADAIKSEPFALQSVEVNGYADPIGRAETNMRLSQERAQTVRQVLLDLGVRGEIVHAIGKGSSDAIVKCPNRGSLKERANCNSPNRRVDIIMRGVRTAE